VHYVDTHCHLDLFQNIRQNVSQEDDIPIKTITVTNSPTLWGPNNKLFKDCRNIRVALGLHPELAHQRAHEIDKFRNACQEAKYIGEIGLDGTSTDANVRQAQFSVFKSILSAIKNEAPKILSVHSRGAAGETINELIKSVRGTQHQVILHWYSGSLDELRRATSAKFYFSINHKMAISRNGQQIINSIPGSLLLTETDAPFTFTERIDNRLKSLAFTVSSLAPLWNCTAEEAKQRIWENFASVLKAAQ
jgi:TatD DNase family protein